MGQFHRCRSFSSAHHVDTSVWQWVGSPSFPCSDCPVLRTRGGWAGGHRSWLRLLGAAPGHVATDFNNFRGTRSPEQGAEVAIRLSTLPSDGPSGAVFEDHTQLAW
jgi:hypothetical protein